MVLDIRFLSSSNCWHCFYISLGQNTAMTYCLTFSDNRNELCTIKFCGINTNLAWIQPVVVSIWLKSGRVHHTRRILLLPFWCFLLFLFHLSSTQEIGVFRLFNAHNRNICIIMDQKPSLLRLHGFNGSNFM